LPRQTRGKQSRQTADSVVVPPVIRNDFAVGEYSPKYFVKTTSMYVLTSIPLPFGRSRKAWTASIDSLSTSTYARPSSRFAHGAANTTRRYPPNPRRFKRSTSCREGVSMSFIFVNRRLSGRRAVKSPS
jgi:hypothetical protein